MIVLDDATWIAKFSSVEDRFISILRLEHATMLLARWCGIDAAETKMHQINGQDICLVRRFDRMHQNGQITRRGFLSARTVFYDDPGFAAVATGSYQRLARWMPRFGAGQADKEQLFKRMVFNVVVRKDDDNDQNHGLVHVGNGRFVLAPAYDIVPNLQPRLVNHHALLIGDSAAGTIENLMGIAESFGLGKDQALSLIQAIEAQVLGHWQEVFYEAGFADEDIRKVAPIMRPIPQHAPGP